MQADQMSMWHLISTASVLVQLVMLTLVLASVMSWVIIVLSTVTACLNIAALTSCDDIRDQAPHLCPFGLSPSCNTPVQGIHTSLTDRLRRADL